MSEWWTNSPRGLRLLLAVVVVQAFFWIVLKPVLFAGNDAEFEAYTPQNAAVAKVDFPSIDAMEGAAFEPIASFPAWHCCDPGYRLLRYEIELEQIPKAGLGIRPRVNADNIEVYANGSFVGGAGRMTLPDVTYNALLRQTYHIPDSALVAGSNEIAVLMVRDASPYFDYYEPIIGEYASMKAAQSYRMFFLGEYKYLALGIISLIAAFAAIVAIRAEHKREAVWFCLVAGSWTLLSLYYVVVDPPLSGNLRLAFYFCVSLGLPLSWFGLVNAWQPARWQHAELVAIAGYVLVCIAMAGSLYLLPQGEGFDQAGLLHDYASLALAAATIVRLAMSIRDVDEERHWEAAIIVLLVTLIAMNAVGELTSAVTWGFLSHTQPFLIIALAAAFLARNVRLFRSSAQINRVLSAQLAERTQDLEAAHNRERQLVKREAHAEERQRLMRDMHDGLGSQLISMLMMARRGKAGPQDFELGLEQVIDEMRLMIDSMDSVGESLDSALVTFRRRLLARLQDAGFSSRWQREDGLTLPALNPREVLQVFRILQEAVTNALKHSGGDEISVSIEAAPSADHAVRIIVADNGAGMADRSPSPHSRGIRNMETRAASIQASLEITASPDGTRVMLDLPASGTDEGAGR